MWKKRVRIWVMLFAFAFAWMVFGQSKTATLVYAETETVTNDTATEQDIANVVSKIRLDSSINQAVGTRNQLMLTNVTLAANTYSLQWVSKNPAIAKVGASNGIIDAVAKGTTTVTCNLKVGSSTYSYSCKVTVTDPKFAASTYYVKTKSSVKLSVSGTTTKNYHLSPWNSKVVTTGYGGVLKSVSAGTVMVSAEVDGRYISCKVIVSAPKVNYPYLFLTTGKSGTLKVTGNSKTTGITYSSSNKKIVTVSSKGVVKGIKKGSAIITVKVDKQSLSCYVGVGKTVIIKALNSAYKALGKKYSQKYRMKKGYYDCSSLVWRSYAPFGYKFGSKTYAPTAASQAQRLVKDKKAIAYKALSTSKLLPGDLIYLKSTSKNGRYKNIGHVAIYIGNGRILHARDEKAGVCINNYSTYVKRIVVIARL